jgi:hypothetical protein
VLTPNAVVVEAAPPRPGEVATAAEILDEVKGGIQSRQYGVDSQRGGDRSRAPRRGGRHNGDGAW